MSGHEYEADEEGRFRETAPMQAFTMGEVTVGVVVFVIGLLVVFGIPLLAA
jgi:hypothetical protein